MPNPYFQFKQFTIWQNACAMKVTTDACLFGAWAAQKFVALQPKTILDIGTGTGLLSLMLAQQNNVTIHTVEIDANAAKQAQENIQQTKWQSTIHVHHLNIEVFDVEEKFDCIITNPPFFENDLKSKNAARNTALHSEQLSLESLYQCIHRLLKPNGSFAVLLPTHRVDYFIKLAEDYHLIEEIKVHQTVHHTTFRSFLFFSKNSKPLTITNTIFIKDANNNYTTTFVELMKPYYLNL